jgi:hypothetical protein
MYLEIYRPMLHVVSYLNKVSNSGERRNAYILFVFLQSVHVKIPYNAQPLFLLVQVQELSLCIL